MFYNISLVISEFLCLRLDILYRTFPIGQLKLNPFKSEVKIFLQNMCEHIF